MKVNQAIKMIFKGIEKELQKEVHKAWQHKDGSWWDHDPKTGKVVPYKPKQGEKPTESAEGKEKPKEDTGKKPKDKTPKKDTYDVYADGVDAVVNAPKEEKMNLAVTVANKMMSQASKKELQEIADSLGLSSTDKVVMTRKLAEAIHSYAGTIPKEDQEKKLKQGEKPTIKYKTPKQEPFDPEYSAQAISSELGRMKPSDKKDLMISLGVRRESDLVSSLVDLDQKQHNQQSK